MMDWAAAKYLLHHHDGDDANLLAVIRRCNTARPKDGKVYIDEARTFLRAYAKGRDAGNGGARSLQDAVVEVNRKATKKTLGVVSGKKARKAKKTARPAKTPKK